MRGLLGTRTGANATRFTAAVTVAAALAASGGASGCSFLFSQGPPDDVARRTYFDCGTSVAPPVLDTVFATAFGVGLASSPSRFATTRERNTAMAVYGGLVALDAAAAIYGFSVSSDCRDARRERAAELAQARVLQPPYGLPPYGAPPPLWPPAPAQPPVGAPAKPPVTAPDPPPPPAPSP